MNNRRNAARNARAPRIAILPYGPSESVTALVGKLTEMGVAPTKLRREGSTFRGRQGDLIINWGNSTVNNFDQIKGQGRALNNPQNIANASHKTRAFQAMADAGVKLVEWTNNSNVAQEWADAGAVVYARTVLQGHSGEGIVVCTTQDLPDLGDIQTSRTLVRAPLYTKGITVQRREFRIHVMNGEVVYVQQKKRTNDYRENPNYSNVVRNYHTGWIYATENVAVNEAGKQEAIKAVAALGLDFGAVDVITRGNEAWVLEVNTAPGLQGTNLDNYATAILAAFRGEEFAPVRQADDDLDALVAGAEEVIDAVARRQEIAMEAMQPAPQAVNIQAMAAAVDLELAVQAAHAAVDNRRGIVEGAIRPAVIAAEELRVNNNGANLVFRNADAAINFNGEPQDKGFYSIRIDDHEENTVGQYNAAQKMFYVIGWDVPVAKADVTVNAPLVV